MFLWELDPRSFLIHFMYVEPSYIFEDFNLSLLLFLRPMIATFMLSVNPLAPKPFSAPYINLAGDAKPLSAEVSISLASASLFLRSTIWLGSSLNSVLSICVLLFVD